jgi:hypothetical protein
MPALRLISPMYLRVILEKYAYEVIDEDAFNWVLKRGDELPLLIPKLGDLVSRIIMEKALQQAQMNNEVYFKFLKEVEQEIPQVPAEKTDSNS